MTSEISPCPVLPPPQLVMLSNHPAPFSSVDYLSGPEMICLFACLDPLLPLTSAHQLLDTLYVSFTVTPGLTQS